MAGCELSTDRWQRDFRHRVPGIHEQLASGTKRRRDAHQGCFACVGMAAIKRADPQGKGKIEECLVASKHEILGSDGSEGKPSAADTSKATAFRKGNRSCGTVDAQHEAGIADQVQHGPRGNTWASTDLQHPHALTDRQRRHRIGNALGWNRHRT